MSLWLQLERSSRKGKMADGFMIAALFMASLNLRPGISSIAPVLESIRGELGMNAAVASLLTSIPVLCMGFFSPLAVKIAARIGIERVIAWSLVLISGGTMLRLVVHSTAILLATSVLAGLGIAAMGPLLSGFIRRHFPRNIPMMIAVYSMALSLGAALGSSLSVPLQMAAHSWRMSLAFWAMLAVAAAPVWYAVVRQREEAPEDTADPAQAAKLPWGSKRAWLLTLHFGLMAFVFYSLMAWLSPITESLGYSRLYAGNVLTIFAVVQIPSSWVLQLLLKRVPSRLLWLLSASLLQLIGFLLILCTMVPWLAAVLLGFGSGMLFALGTLLPIDAASGPQEASSLAAMTQSAGYIIGALGPILLGWFNDMTHQFGLAVLLLIFVTVILMVIQALICSRNTNKKLKAVTQTTNMQEGIG
ncbi:CynX/NimT family MFS transporter [Paenibacillus sp. OAS669]|uniref:MFS transporter n=1 Tax=Paenibacillus sp. OAS669 TaxID=2663821 RepID=UPI001789D2B6|nr:MFS transporter [Paenibacillus sp. OAS669]MBE1442378.1 CP family cyanate transporter-like MFS transporter [Paenibacillus sp. OAS669]